MLPCIGALRYRHLFFRMADGTRNGIKSQHKNILSIVFGIGPAVFVAVFGLAGIKRPLPRIVEKQGAENQCDNEKCSFHSVRDFVSNAFGNGVNEGARVFGLRMGVYLVGIVELNNFSLTHYGHSVRHELYHG